MRKFWNAVAIATQRLSAALCVVVVFGAGCGGSSSGGDPNNQGSGGTSGTGGGSAGNSSGGTAGSSSGGSAGVGAGGSGGSGGSGIVPADIACDVPSDCVVVPNSCCGTCGRPTIEDMLAVRKDRTEEVAKQVCPEPEPCPKCATFENPALIATCQAGRCTLIDLETHPVTECGTDSDCRLRTNTCCECGGPTDPGHLIAVGKSGGLESLVCDPGFGCDECVPQYPPDALAVCSAGHCVASYYIE